MLEEVGQIDSWVQHGASVGHSLSLVLMGSPTYSAAQIGCSLLCALIL